MKISKETRKKIEKEVNKFIKSLAIKDEEGVVIDKGLTINHQQLLTLYRQNFFLALPTDDERLYAKQYFKNQLPYKEWLEAKQRDPEGMMPDIEDFQELYNPKYKRITERRTS